MIHSTGAKQAWTLRQSVRRSDAQAVRDIVTSSGFFSDVEVEVAVELVEDRLAEGEQSDYRFVFADIDGVPRGYACFGPIECTRGSFDLYWIAVENAHRGGGLGAALLAEVERLIAAAGGRRIYVETSSRPQYESTRTFYERCGYRADAVQHDFYAPGEARIMYVKAL